MTISFVSAGTFDVRGNTAHAGQSTAPGTPAGVSAGDLKLCWVMEKYPTGPPATPAGWTLEESLLSGTIDCNVAGTDGGDVRLTLFSRYHQQGDTPPTFPLQDAGGFNILLAQITAYKTDSPGKRLTVKSLGGVSDKSAPTYTVTRTKDASLQANDLLLHAYGQTSNSGADPTMTSIATTGLTYGAITQRVLINTSIGGDGYFLTWSIPVTAGSSATASGLAIQGQIPFGGRETQPVLIRLREEDVPESSYKDSFNRTASTNIGAVLTEVVGDAQIASNALSAVTTGANVIVRSTRSLSSSDHGVSIIGGYSATAPTSGFSNGLRIGVLFRADEALNSYYFAYIKKDSNSAYVLVVQKVVNGGAAENLVADVPLAAVTGNGATITAEVSGNRILVSVSGIVMVDTVDTAIPTGTYTGVYIYSQSSTRFTTADEFRAYELHSTKPLHVATSVSSGDTGTIPFEAQQGDILVAHAWRDGANSSPAKPNGWMSIADIGGFFTALMSVVKTYQPGDTNPQFLNASSVSISVIRNVVGVKNTAVVNNGNDSTLTFGNLTLNSASHSLVLTGQMHRDAPTLSTPSGLTERGNLLHNATGRTAVATGFPGTWSGKTSTSPNVAHWRTISCELISSVHNAETDIALIDSFARKDEVNGPSATWTTNAEIPAGSVLVLATNKTSGSGETVGVASISNLNGNVWAINAAASNRLSTHDVGLHICECTSAVPAGTSFTVTWHNWSSRKVAVGGVFKNLKVAVEATTGAHANVSAAASNGPNGDSTAESITLSSGSTTKNLMLGAFTYGGTNQLSTSGNPVGRTITTVGTTDRGVGLSFRTFDSAKANRELNATLLTSAAWAAAGIVLGQKAAAAPVGVVAQEWNGTAWVNLTVEYWNGTTFVPYTFEEL